LFSGSLYLIACSDLLKIKNAIPFIGPITPIGGTLFILGWLMLVIAAFMKEDTGRKKKTRSA